MNTPIRFILFCLASVFLPTANAVLDTTITSSFQVQITITKTCTITSGTPITFGSVVANTVPAKASTNLSVTCSKGTPYTIGLQPSNGDTAGAGNMSGTGANGDKVAYQLYSTANGSTIWGNTTSGTPNIVSGSGQGALVAVPVYAGVANTNLTPDTYTDTVTVTFTY